MSFITFRRFFLDNKLEEYSGDFKGKILDLGGQKEQRRGRFQIPSHLKESWLVLNNNPAVLPDIICSLPDIKCVDKSIDTILMTEVIEYICDVQKLISEMSRVLKDDGLAYVSSPFLNPLHGDSESDFYRYTESGLKKIFSEHFEIVRLERMGSIYSVYGDTLLSYASTYPSLFIKVVSKIIRLSAPIMILAENILFGKNTHINTGFWLVLKKKSD